MTLTIRTRIMSNTMPNTGGYTDSGDSSSDEGILTPTSSTDSSSDGMEHGASSSLLSSAAPMARNDKLPSFASPIPTTTDSPEEGQGGAATPRPSHTQPPTALRPLYPFYPVVPITAEQACMIDDLSSEPPGTPGPSKRQTPNFTISNATYTAPADSSAQSPWNAFSNNPPSWNTDDGEDDLEVGMFISRSQRQQELLEMEQIEAAIAASRADLPEFVACSKEQERVMTAYAEDSSIPRPRLETKEDEEFFSELLPTEIVSDDEDTEDAINNLEVNEEMT